MLSLKFLIICVCYCVKILNVIAEVITLVNENNITCILTGTHSQFAVYVNPPIKSGFTEQTAELNNWINDDWQRTDSYTSFHSPVTDKRWEDFKVFGTEDGYALRENPISFSVYTSDYAIFNIHSHHFENSVQLNITTNNNNPTRNGQICGWFHYSVFKKNNTITFIPENRANRTYELHFSPDWIYFGNPCSYNSTGKLHKYDFRSSNMTTSQESYLNVTFTDNLCLSMFVSVDPDCFLDVNLEFNNMVNTTRVYGFKENGFLKKWERHEIRAHSAGEAKLSFFRGHMKNKKNGYWAIDEIKFCSRNIEIYQTHLSEEFYQTFSHTKEEHVCKVLQQSDELLSNDTVRIHPCDKPGFLGANCNVSCRVLGESYPYCENHKICQENSNCFCSWGYQWPCDKRCNRGTWGLFCKKRCMYNCKNCNSSTGECLEKIDINANLTHSELPNNITLSSRKIFITLPDYREINGNVTYHFNYVCVSEWCRNETIQEEDITIASGFGYDRTIIHNFDKLMPFTDYQLIVIATRKKQTLARTYSKIRAQSEPNVVNNLAVYSRSDTKLWVKFQPSVTNMSRYIIWCYEKNSKRTPMNSNSIERCELWSDFLCGIVTNLENNRTYTIAVEENNVQGKKSRLSTSITDRTCQQVSEAPENLKLSWFSDEEFFLTWDFQFCSNGPVQYFDVEINEQGSVKHKKIFVEEQQKSYIYKNPLKHGSKYSCNVRAMNNSEKSWINVTISPSNLKWFSFKLLVETCNTMTCHLLIPKIQEFEYRDYHVLVIHNDEVKNEGEKKVLEIFKSLKNTKSRNEKQWIVTEIQNNSKFVQLDIGKALGKKFSVFINKTYTLYFVLSVNGHYEIYPFYFIDGKISQAEYIYLLYVPCLLVVGLIFLVYLLYSLKSKTDYIENERISANVRLLPPMEFDEKSTNIEVKNFEHYLKNALTCKNITNQFYSLSDKKIKTCTTGLYKNNVNKNKNEQIVPYDETRVILKIMNGMGIDDYINASYIDGFDRPKAYIATQGPKFSTVKDFWRMIWQEQAKVIVMVTNFIENKKRQCAEYWPQRLDAIFECGEMAIKLIKEDVYEHYDCRIFEVYYGKYCRKVQHFHLKWNPDNLTPFYPNNIVPLIKRIRQIRENSNAPIVIHCSSGVNRTGTIILCDLCLQMAKTRNCVNFYALLKKMREQRPQMIKSVVKWFDDIKSVFIKAN